MASNLKNSISVGSVLPTNKTNEDTENFLIFVQRFWDCLTTV
jgi:hypothetical protein